MDNSVLENCYVIRGGQIQGGVIRVLSNSVLEKGHADEGGGYYSDDLLRYSYHFFRAEINLGDLLVINQGRIIATIDPATIWWVDSVLSYPVKVMAGGWLIGGPGMEAVDQKYLNAFLATDRGEIPPFRDNSTFFKVTDPKYIGRTLFLIRAGHGKDFRVVDTVSRQIVPALAEHPLARAVPFMDPYDADFFYIE